MKGRGVSRCGLVKPPAYFLCGSEHQSAPDFSEADIYPSNKMLRPLPLEHKEADVNKIYVTSDPGQKLKPYAFGASFDGQVLRIPPEIGDYLQSHGAAHDVMSALMLLREFPAPLSISLDWGLNDVKKSTVQLIQLLEKSGYDSARLKRLKRYKPGTHGRGVNGPPTGHMAS